MSLAKYVLAEMPPEVFLNILPLSEKEQILQLTTLDNGGDGVIRSACCTIRFATRSYCVEDFRGINFSVRRD
ncbi:MAG: hypothetical protein U0936_18565 [Planctomycetaceae bacterium]